MRGERGASAWTQGADEARGGGGRFERPFRRATWFMAPPGRREAMRAVLPMLLLLVAPPVLASSAGFETREGVLTVECPVLVVGSWDAYPFPSTPCSARHLHPTEGVTSGSYVADLAWDLEWQGWTDLRACLTTMEPVGPAGDAWIEVGRDCRKGAEAQTLRVPASDRERRVDLSVAVVSGEADVLFLFLAVKEDVSYTLRHEP